MDKIRIPIFHRDSVGEGKLPDYNYSYQDEDGKWHNVIAGWTKLSAKGAYYISLSIDRAELKKYILKQEAEQKRNEKNKTQ